MTINDSMILSSHVPRPSSYGKKSGWEPVYVLSCFKQTGGEATLSGGEEAEVSEGLFQFQNFSL